MSLDLQAKNQSFAAVSISNSINKLEFERIGLGVSSRNLSQTFIFGTVLFGENGVKKKLWWNRGCWKWSCWRVLNFQKLASAQRVSKTPSKETNDAFHQNQGFSKWNLRIFTERIFTEWIILTFIPILFLSNIHFAKGSISPVHLICELDQLRGCWWRFWGK